MGQSEIEKIKIIIENYRKVKLKFFQFIKLLEALISEEKLLDIELKNSNDAGMELLVLDSPVFVQFSLVLSPENVPMGKVDFIKLNEFDEPRYEHIHTLYFNQLGNILESISDTFSNRRINDEHDIPNLIHRFLQKYLQSLRIKETKEENK